MTEAEQVFAELEKRGVTLHVAGDRLRFSPKDAVGHHLIEALRAHKTELIQLVQKRTATEVTEDISPNHPGNSGVLSSENGLAAPNEPDCDSIIAGTVKRINEAFPPSSVITDWHEIDRWHWALYEGRNCGDTEGVRRIAAEFELEMQRQYPKENRR